MSLPERVRAWLNEETAIWTKEGLIGEAQRERILARYPDEAGSGRMTFVLRTLGVIVLFASLLLVISHNWTELGRGGRMGAVTGVLVLLQGIALAYFLRERPTGSLLGHLASCAGFGAAIITTGQVFHLDNHSPDAVLAWALGILPIVLLLRSALLHILYLVLIGTWYGMKTSITEQAPALAYLALIAPTAWAAYFRRPSNIGGINFLQVADAALVAAVAWSFAFLLLILCGTYQVLPAAVISLPLAIAALHLPGDPRARGWRFVGMLALAGQFLALGDFDDIVRNLWRSQAGEFMPWNTLPWLSYPTSALVLLALWIRRKGTGRAEAILAATGIVLGLLPRIGLPEALGQSLLVSSANIAALGMAAYLMHLGLSEGRLRPYTYGALLFFVWLGWRYSDYQEELGYLGMAAVFAAIGIGLFVLARVWRNRKSEPVVERVPEMGSDPLAPWFERALRQAKPLVIATHVAQLAVIGWMVWHHFEPLRNGQRILLRVEPVDPRDMLRGDYVVLGYDFSVMSDKDAKEVAVEMTEMGVSTVSLRQNSRLPGDTDIYLPLKVGADGVAAPAGRPSIHPPLEGPFLVGKTRYSSLRFGIEAFYVTEGEGKKWEKRLGDGELLAEIALLPDGRAGLVELRPDPSPMQPVPIRVLRGWIDRGSSYWRPVEVDSRETFDRMFTPYKPEKGTALPQEQPDFAKERIIYIPNRNYRTLKKAVGNSHRIRLTTDDEDLHSARAEGDKSDGDDLLIAVPRDERVIRVDNRRLEDLDEDR